MICMLDIIKNNRDIIITIGIHICIPIVYAFVIFMYLFLVLSLYAQEFARDIFAPFPLNFKIIPFVILSFVFLLLLVSRLCILPCLYSFYEKNSTSNLLKKFIHKLKTSILCQTVIICIAELLSLIFCVSDILSRNIIVDFAFFKKFFEMHCALTAGVDLLGCYIALFIWWKYQDKIKFLFKKYHNKVVGCEIEPQNR